MSSDPNVFESLFNYQHLQSAKRIVHIYKTKCTQFLIFSITSPPNF